MAPSPIIVIGAGIVGELAAIEILDRARADALAPFRYERFDGAGD